MKTLYESILSSTKSGVSAITDKIVEWFKEKNETIATKSLRDSNVKLVIEPYKGGYSLDIVDMFKTEDGSTFKISEQDCEKFVKLYNNRYGIQKYPIRKVMNNGHICNMLYAFIYMEDMSECVDEVYDTIRFGGCLIKNLNALPKNCKTVDFDRGNKLGGGYGCTVSKIENISVDNFYVGMETITGYSGLYCSLDNIKNITVKKCMIINPHMLSAAMDEYGSCLEKGAKKLNKAASEMLDRFFARNNVSESIVQYEEHKRNETIEGNIKRDPKTNQYKFIKIK